MNLTFLNYTVANATVTKELSTPALVCIGNAQLKTWGYYVIGLWAVYMILWTLEPRTPSPRYTFMLKCFVPVRNILTMTYVILVVLWTGGYLWT